MGLTSYNETVVLTRIDCGRCGGTYAINETYRVNQYQVGGDWHCPYCQCSVGYSGNNENARLKAQLEAAKQRERWEHDRAEAHRLQSERNARRAAAARGQVTKIKRHVSKGVCPCCNRTFMDLSRHMETKHPEFAGVATEDESA